VKLVALDNLQAAAIPQSSEPNENKGGKWVALGPIIPARKSRVKYAI
jgi:hypothetical protein